MDVKPAGKSRLPRLPWSGHGQTRIARTRFLLIALVLPACALAGETRHPIKQDTISAVSSTSITISHTAYKTVKGKPQERTVIRTYQITSFTDIEVDGAKAAVDDLHTGMAVTVCADAPSDTDPSDGGVARGIRAH